MPDVDVAPVLADLVARGADARVLGDSLAAARRARPGVDVPCADLRAAILDRLDAGVDAAAIDMTELYIAVICAAGVDAAIAAFDATYLPKARPALFKLGLAEWEIDEVAQVIRERLLMARGEAPARIVGLAGSGGLGKLVRVVAIRSALNLRRAERRFVPDDGALAERLLASTDDPELALIDESERQLAKAAVEVAFGALAPRERTLLRLSLIDRMTVDDIGDLCDVHRATAARWLERLRDRVGRDTRRELRRRLGRPNVESLLARVHSRIELRLSRLLAVHA